jgi:hypothetical protein
VARIKTVSEASVDWAQWDKACEYWVLFGSSAEFKPVRDAIAMLSETDRLGSRHNEKLAIFVKSWHRFRADMPCDVELKYKIDEDGIPHLIDEPDHTAGGIDLGDPKDDSAASFSASDTATDGPPLSAAEVKERTDWVIAERLEHAKKALEKAKTRRLAKKAAKGDNDEANGAAGAPATQPLTRQEVEAKQRAE